MSLTIKKEITKALENVRIAEEELTLARRNVNIAVERVNALLVDIESQATGEDLIGIVCKYYSLSKQDIKRKTRQRKYLMPRQVAIYLLRKFSTLSYNEIGKVFQCDHTTIISSFNTIQNQLKIYKDLQEDITVLETLILNK